MSKSSTVSVKITPEMKRQLKQYKIKPSEVMRRALLEEIQRKKIQQIESQLNTVKDQLEKIDIHEAVEMIREDRDQR